MRPSIYNLARAKPSLAIALRTNGTVNGTTVDLHENKDAARSAVLIVHAGTVTDGTHTVSLQESDDDSTWAAAPAASLQGSVPAITSANDETVYELGYVGTKRYLRAVVVTASATTGGTLGAVIQRAFPRRRPISHA